jgi:hypothetical protein
MRVVVQLVLTVGGLVAMLAALALDVGWLAAVILPFWIGGLFWVESDQDRAIFRGMFRGTNGRRRS